MNLVAGGMVRRDEQDGSVRIWAVDSQRMFRWSGHNDADAGEVFVVPVPGNAPVVCADPWPTPLVLLADGEGWRASVQWGRAVRWTRCRNLLTVRVHVETEDMTSPRLIAGWIERRHTMRRVVGITNERQVLLMAEDATAVPVGSPIPGTAAVLAVHVDARDSATALLDDGRLLLGTRRGWSEAGTLGGAGLVRLRALVGFRLDREHKIAPGDAFEAGAERARELIGRGWAEAAGDAP